MSYQHFYKTSALFLFLFFPSILFSQTITDQLKVADCDYEIVYETKKLNVIKQIIIKRGSYQSNYNWDSESGYGYGFGYESYHLEFVYLNNEDIKNTGNITIEFFDTDGEMLASYNYSTFLNKKSQFPKFTKLKKYYSINLCNVPLLILDDTKRIVIK